jgi:hypothetical protein
MNFINSLDFFVTFWVKPKTNINQAFIAQGRNILYFRSNHLGFSFFIDKKETKIYVILRNIPMGSLSFPRCMPPAIALERNLF